MRYLSLVLIIFVISIEARSAKTDHAEITIVGNTNIISEPGVIQLGYKFVFTPGWHTYWINPGDSGGPPIFEFNSPSGWDINENVWPGPQKIIYPPLMTFGYVDEVIFPFELNLKNLNDQDTEITTKFLVCDDICVPEEATLLLSLKNGILNIDEKPEELKKWLNRVPIRAPPEMVLSSNENNFTLEYASLNSNSYFFPFDDSVMDYSDEQNFSNNKLNFEVFDDFNKSLKGVVNIGQNYYEVEQLSQTATADTITGISLLTAIIFAFLGGLILNLMPCVLPVIALKGLSLVKSSAESNSSVTLNASAYVVGVIATFMTIAVILVSLKNAGEMIGWGYQLQSPFIVTILSILIFGIGIYLITDLSVGGSLGKLEKHTDGSGPMNSFLTGTLAVVVASPCTAPFMGAALGFALIQPDIFSYLVFLFLALGFALPYFLIALFPSLIDFLPKPGKWMKSLKQLFGFMMFAAAIWLLWVLANQVDANSILFVLIGWFLLAFTSWLVITRIKFAVYVSGIIGILWVYQLSEWNFKDVEVINDSESISWSIEKENELRSNEQAYFINFTAAWCITCKVNEAVAFSDEVFKKFDEKNITYLKADWTNRNSEIAGQIEKYNRSGIPLYIYWNKKLDEPMVLNEILTENYLMEVVDEI
ncbi:MAG: protein-disulfide reductase DsbD domain-containing protein [Pseudomonadota bacterium]|nr:protein-disulfide reductase DsbD domain-containing protein [Pseudomonadota bacterium]